MNTPTHSLLAMALLSKRGATKRNWAVFIGSLIPDAVIYVWAPYMMFVKGVDGRTLWDELYFEAPMQDAIAFVNSIPIYVALAIIGVALPLILRTRESAWTRRMSLRTNPSPTLRVPTLSRRLRMRLKDNSDTRPQDKVNRFTARIKTAALLLLAFALAALTHIATDLPVHAHDAYRHFWPLSDFRFYSPLSYYESDHHSGLVSLAEALIAFISIAVLWRRFPKLWVRIVLAILACLYIALQIMMRTMTLGVA